MAIDPSAEYPGQVITGNPAYPFGQPRNVTVPGDGTGTPLERKWVSDLFGLFQALLDAAFMTPSGAPDQVGASQYFDAIKRLRRMDTEGIRLANTDEYDTIASNNNVSVIVAGPQTGEMAVVIAGVGAEISTSHDATTFTSRAPGGAFAGNFNCGAASPSAVVLAGASAEIQSSTDGITWTHRTAAAAYGAAWICAAYGAGLFVLLGEDGEIQTSPDGITWTQRTPPTGFGVGDDWKSLCFDGSRFVAIGGIAGNPTDCFVALSTNGITWTPALGAPTAGPTSDGGIVSVDGRIVVVGATGGVHVSDDDGATWTPVTILGSTGAAASPTTICAARGILAAIGIVGTTYEAFVSQNGDEWIGTGKVAGNVGVRSLVYAADRWLAARSAGFVIRSLKAAAT